MLRRLLGVFTNGRPMKRLDYRFTDMVSKKRVYRYLDTKGRMWLATSAWSMFRVRVL